MGALRRGEVWHADIDGRGGPHFYLVVSNNRRNKSLDTVLVVPLTTKDRSHLAGLGTQVRLTPQDAPERDWVKCDDLFELWDDEVSEDRPMCSLSRATMDKVGAALAVALSI